jgi:hypothetical protein
MLSCQQGGTPSLASAENKFHIYHPKKGKQQNDSLILLIEKNVFPFNRKTKVYIP